MLTPLSIRGFNPLTSGRNKRQRKMDLKEKLVNKLQEKSLKLEKIRRLCKGNPLAIRVKYYLLETDMENTSKKDLDNLLKILFDVLSYNMIENNNEESLRGLALMNDDKMVYEIRCTKRIVNKLEDAGLDISIFESSIN